MALRRLKLPMNEVTDTNELEIQHISRFIAGENISRGKYTLLHLPYA